MTDAELFRRWGSITDPYEALDQLVEHQMFLGDDPYYRDLDAALMTMAARCSVRPLVDVWAEDPDHSVEHWKYEVENDDTRSSYHQWVASQKEQANDQN